jgi:hypothetical protein
VQSDKKKKAPQQRENPAGLAFKGGTVPGCPGGAGGQAERPYFFWNLPTRPAVSTIFC